MLTPSLITFFLHLLPTIYHRVELLRRVHKYCSFMNSFTCKAISLLPLKLTGAPFLDLILFLFRKWQTGHLPANPAKCWRRSSRGLNFWLNWELDPDNPKIPTPSLFLAMHILPTIPTLTAVLRMEPWKSKGLLSPYVLNMWPTRTSFVSQFPCLLKLFLLTRSGQSAFIWSCQFINWPLHESGASLWTNTNRQISFFSAMFRKIDFVAEI